MYYAYILLCADGTYYCGYTDDVEKRLRTHNAKKGAKYTRTRVPVKLAYCETFLTKSEALKREYALKQLTHADKESLAARFAE